jgi:spore coat polysaccharide biosynthesis predicted glycosyltransferase SpsG
VRGDAGVRPWLAGMDGDLADWQGDGRRRAAALRDADAALVDSYLAPPDVYRAVCDGVPAAAYVDDDNRLPYPPGIVVNGSIFPERFDYPAAEGVTRLLGPRYIPLRSVFWDLPSPAEPGPLRTLLVTFGGTDLRDLTPRCVRALAAAFPSLRLRVVVAPAFANREAIEEALGGAGDVLFDPAPAEICRAMRTADAAVSAAGQTLYELACVGVPTVAVTVADNQRHDAAGWQEAGFLAYAGHWSDPGLLDAVRRAVEGLRDPAVRARAARAGRGLVDGRGALRVARCLLERARAPGL